jgi:hypothetical protein
MKYLGPLTKSGILRIGVLLLGFYFAVQSLTGSSKLDRAILIEDLRATAQDLASISASRVPESLDDMKKQGLMTKDLVERCQQAKVGFHPENIANRDGLAVFSVPNEDSNLTRVTSTGLVIQ